MVPREAIDAFYAARRTEALPLAVNDVVTVKTGNGHRGTACVISLNALTPEPMYLVEYPDGSDEILPLSRLQL